LLIKSARFANLKRWAFVSGEIAMMQMVVQGLSAVTGLFLVRLLPKDQYAWFTIAGSLMATMSILSDGGLTTGLTSIGGGIHAEPRKLSQLVADVFWWRRRIASVILLVVPILYIPILKSGEQEWGATCGILVAAALTSWPSTTTAILNTAIRLKAQIGAIKISEIIGACLRFVLVGITLFAGFRTAFAFVVAGSVGAVAHLFVVKKLARPLLLGETPEYSYRKELRSSVQSLYANHVFTCIQAQISMWIIAFVAGSNEVADLGALTRLAVLFTVIGAPLTYLVLPSFAKIECPKELGYRFFLVVTLMTSVCALFILAAWRWPEPFLMILGGKYKHLNGELPLALCGQALGLLNTISWGLLIIRGWVKRVWLTIPLTMVGFVLGAWFCQLDSVAGILQFTIWSVMPTFLVGLVRAVQKLRDPRLRVR
jgi:O-antigen/teichoic acid export membrane protein